MRGIFIRGILTMLLLLLMATQFFAETISELEDKRDKVQEDIEKSEDEIVELEKKLDELYAIIDDLDIKIIEIIEVIEDLEKQIVDKKIEIELAKNNLEASLVREEKYKKQIQDRIVIMYEYGDTQYIDVLMESENLEDFFTRIEYIDKIMEYDEGMLQKLEQIQEQINDNKTKLEFEENELEYLMLVANEEKDEFNNLINEKNKQIEIVESNKGLLEAQIKRLEKENEDLEKMIAKKIEEQKNSLKFTDGTFKWPVPNYSRISSYFGPRNNPVLGHPEIHTGIDIPAPSGTNIIAAGSGIVIWAQTKGTYGKLVIINHGSGFNTYYAHNSKILVSEGDAVVKGQVICKMGTTGRSTGNHLHFSIRKDNVFVDPLKYFKISY